MAPPRSLGPPGKSEEDCLYEAVDDDDAAYDGNASLATTSSSDSAPPLVAPFVPPLVAPYKPKTDVGVAASSMEPSTTAVSASESPAMTRSESNSDVVQWWKGKNKLTAAPPEYAKMINAFNAAKTYKDGPLMTVTSTKVWPCLCAW